MKKFIVVLLLVLTCASPAIAEKLGEYLYRHGYTQTSARFRATGRFERRPFNPKTPLPFPYAVDSSGRTIPNPAYLAQFKERYGFTLPETNGSPVGERWGQEKAETFCRLVGLEVPGAQEQMDAWYVSKGSLAAWDGLILPYVAASEAPPVVTPPVVTPPVVVPPVVTPPVVVPPIVKPPKPEPEPAIPPCTFNPEGVEPESVVTVKVVGWYRPGVQSTGRLTLEIVPEKPCRAMKDAKP